MGGVWTIDPARIARTWDRKGFDCQVWVDPPGQVQANYVHDLDQLVLLLDGEVELSIGRTARRLRPGKEVLIPAGTRHSLSNVGQVTARWLYGYGASGSGSKV